MIRTLVLASLLFTLLSCRSDEAQKSADEKKDNRSEPVKDQRSNLVSIKPDVRDRVGLHVAEVQARPVRTEFSTPGQISLNEERTVHVGSYADGRVVELDAMIGAYVQKGAVLAKLHSHTVHETRAALQNATQEVARQQEVVEYRRRMRDRMQRLLALKSASPQEVERSQSELQSAETDLQNARINQKKETIHLADLLRLPEQDVGGVNEQTELAPILSPINGTVTDRKITVGSIVEPGQETFTVSDLSSVWMIAAVNEMDLAKLRLGDSAKIVSQAYPDQAFSGRVSFIAPEVNPETRTLQARIVLPNADRRLHPGMFVNAQIAERSFRQSIFIPELAIQDLSGGSVVFVQKSQDQYEPRPVRIAHRMNGEAEIAGGLKAGEKVVTDGSFVVKSELLKSQIGQ